jgi:hypothetical protein
MTSTSKIELQKLCRFVRIINKGVCLFCGQDDIDKSHTTDIIFNNDLQNC